MAGAGFRLACHRGFDGRSPERRAYLSDGKGAAFAGLQDPNDWEQGPKAKDQRGDHELLANGLGARRKADNKQGRGRRSGNASGKEGAFGAGEQTDPACGGSSHPNVHRGLAEVERGRPQGASSERAKRRTSRQACRLV